MDQLSLFPEPPTEAVCHVYAGVRGGQIKIGITRRDPSRRARELGIVLLRTEPGDEQAERELHRRFRSARIDREWFMPSAEVLAWIAGERVAAA